MALDQLSWWEGGGGGESVTLNLTSLYFGANCFREQGGILPEFSFFLSDL